MDRIKIYIVGDSYYYAEWIENYELVDSLEKANIVFFTGGEDVTPSLYGHRNIHSMYNSTRDARELKVFEQIKPSQLALGVCRGAQWLCSMNGGKLYQDVRGHALRSTHAITDGSRILEITSTHHQMQCPFNLPLSDYRVLWWSPEKLSHIYEWGGSPADFICPPVEPEIVEYHVKGKPISLAIQGHPEMMRVSSPTINELNKLLRSCLKKIKLQNLQ